MSFKIAVKKQPTGPTGPSLLYTLDNPTAFGTSAGDYFGYSTSISDNYAIVGAYFEEDSGGIRSGKAYIFSTTTGNLLHTLDNPNPFGTSAIDQFGYSVAISDNYAIVGAINEDDSGLSNTGIAYIFSNTTGNLVHTINNPSAFGTAQFDAFGWSVGVTDTYAIVGARNEGDSGGTLSGKAYIFSTTTGNLLHTLDNPNAFGTSASDNFGISSAISNDYAIVGAWSEDDSGGLSSGKAYIFSTTTGNLLHTLDNPNAFGTSADDKFGLSVSISDNYAIVGTRNEDDSSGTDSGKAYIFSTTTGNLLHTLDNPNAFGTSADDQFGNSVSITDNYAIVGAYDEDDSGVSDSGKAYIFSTATGNLLYTLDNPNAFGTSTDDWFGISVSISNNYAIVGAYGEDDSGGTTSGKAYIYSLT